MRMTALAILVAFSLIGCATIPAPAPPTVIVIPKSFDAAWTAVLKVLTIQHDLPLKVIEKDSGIIATDWVTYQRPVSTLMEAFAVSSAPGFQQGIQIRFTVNVLIEQAESGSRVTIRDHVEQSTGHAEYSTGMRWSATGEQPETLRQIKRELLEQLGGEQQDR